MAVAFCCSIANAQIIYSNAFNGGHANINNTAPTVANDFAGGSSTATWLDALGTNDTGFLSQGGANSSTLGNSWTLPFTPQQGYVYNLTATLTFTGNPGTWVGIGFAQLHNTDNINGYARYSDHGNDGGLTTGGPNGYDWMILTESSGNLQTFLGPHAVGQQISQNGYFTAGLGSHAVDVVLDTSSTLWSAAWYVDGSEVGPAAYTTNPNIGAVGITQNAVSGPQYYSWSDFALTAMAVPEPSTLGLIGVGLAMMLFVTFYRKRRQDSIRKDVSV